MFRAGLYARVSTSDQQTLSLRRAASNSFSRASRFGRTGANLADLHGDRPGRAMAGLLAIFAEFEREILRERTRAGLAHARENGKRLGRPATAAIHAAEIRKLHRTGVSKSEIARRVQVGRTSVRRILAALLPRRA
jgi:DNA invertase Pin-like site-specific DNA recombinase